MSLDRLFFRYAVYLPTVWVRGEPLSRCLRELAATERADAATLRRLQEDKLNRLIDFAAREVPYYQARLDRSQLPRRLTLEDTQRLPVLTKDDLRTHWSALRAPRPGRTSVKTTGGSTGQAVTVVKSREATGYELAAMWRGWGWAGIEIGDRQARFWGVPFSRQGRWRSRLIDFVSHRRRYSAFGMTEAAMAETTTELNRYQPDFVYGYVSILYEYAAYLTRTRGRRFRPKAVIATSEVLTEAHRREIAEGFGCRVFEEYGCGELGNIAHECDGGRLHLCSENMIVETLDVGGRATTGTGEIVVTELNNLAMPLVRYRLRDFGHFSGDTCACGCTLPVLADVVGRAYDMVHNREGQVFHGEFFMYIFEDAKKRGFGFDAFQVIQQDLDRFLIKVKPGPGYGAESEAFVRERIQAGYGRYADVVFERVEGIAREASGKLRLIISTGTVAAGR
jgi:phenylacetate-CoA ligase